MNARAARRARMLEELAAYHPSFPGVHVCGIDEEAERFFTQADFPRPTDAAALSLFERLRAEFAAAPGEPTEFVVDLNLHDGCDRDFPISRQMLDRLVAAAEAE